jgi:hypothetical protein
MNQSNHAALIWILLVLKKTHKNCITCTEEERKRGQGLGKEFKRCVTHHITKRKESQRAQSRDASSNSAERYTQTSTTHISNGQTNAQQTQHVKVQAAQAIGHRPYPVCVRMSAMSDPNRMPALSAKLMI